MKKEVVKVIKTEPSKKKVVMSSSLSDLHALRLRLEGAEGMLSEHIHICFGDDGVHHCGLKITQLEVSAWMLWLTFSKGRKVTCFESIWSF